MEPKANISIINGKPTLTRYLYYVDTNEDPPVKKYKEIVDVLDISAERFEVLCDNANDGKLSSYCGWVKNAEHVFYISMSYQRKNYNQPIVKKATLNKKVFAEIETIDEFFIKTKTEVFYCGKKIKEADAASFRKVEHTHFYEDDNAVYAYNITDGLSVIHLPKESRYFIPHCWYFADENNIYHQSSWSNKIETAEPWKKMEMHHVSDLIVKNIWGADAKKYRAASNTEAMQKHWDFSRGLDTYADIFSHFFPEVNAIWNIKKSAQYANPLKEASFAASGDRVRLHSLIMLLTEKDVFSKADITEIETSYNALAARIEKSKAIDKTELDKSLLTNVYDSLYKYYFIPAIDKLKTCINEMKINKKHTEADKDRVWQIYLHTGNNEYTIWEEKLQQAIKELFEKKSL